MNLIKRRLIDIFDCISRRGEQVKVNQVITKIFMPLSPMQTRVCFRIYCTTNVMQSIVMNPITIYLHVSGNLDKLLFAFIFGKMEIAVTVMNVISRQHCKLHLEIDI